jgi:hypothetical protein
MSIGIAGRFLLTWALQRPFFQSENQAGVVGGHIAERGTYRGREVSSICESRKFKVESRKRGGGGRKAEHLKVESGKAKFEIGNGDFARSKMLKF